MALVLKNRRAWLMFFALIPNNLPKLLSIGIFFLIFVLFAAFLGVLHSAKLRLGLLCVSVYVSAWLPWIFDRIGWVNFERLQIRINNVASDRMQGVYKRFINFLLVFFATASLSLALFYNWLGASFENGTAIASMLILSAIVLEYSMIELTCKIRGTHRDDS